MGKSEDDKYGEDTPSRQSLPVHQRPPQWDYIYRANKTERDKALADASLAESEIDGLEQRRTELEKEQAVLWCKLAFRAVEKREIADKELLRCELVSDADNADQTKALSAAARFLAASLAVVAKAEHGQSAAFGGVAIVVAQAREALKDDLRQVPDLKSEWESTKTDLGKFYKLSQTLADKAKTLAESYKGAMDGDMNKEAARKERFRGMLQESVVEYAEILLALDELTERIKGNSNIRVDTKQRVTPLKLAWEAPSPLDSLASMADQDEHQDAPPRAQPKPKPVKKGAKRRAVIYQFRTQQEAEAAWSFTDDNWRLENGGLRFPGWEGSMVSKQSYGGDLAVEIRCSGRELLIKAYGEEFRGPDATWAQLERKGHVLTFRTNRAVATQVLLKQSQMDVPTTILIGHYGTPFFLNAVAITGTPIASDEPEPLFPVAP